MKFIREQLFNTSLNAIKTHFRFKLYFSLWISSLLISLKYLLKRQFFKTLISELSRQFQQVPQKALAANVRSDASANRVVVAMPITTALIRGPSIHRGTISNRNAFLAGRWRERNDFYNTYMKTTRLGPKYYWSIIIVIINLNLHVLYNMRAN